MKSYKSGRRGKAFNRKHRSGMRKQRKYAKVLRNYRIARGGVRL